MTDYVVSSACVFDRVCEEAVECVLDKLCVLKEKASDRLHL